MGSGQALLYCEDSSMTGRREVGGKGVHGSPEGQGGAVVGDQGDLRVVPAAQRHHLHWQA